MSTSKNIRYIPAVDHLRAYAALLVVVYHTLLRGIPLDFAHWPRAGNPFQSLIYEGHTGVSLFLVLSGFIFTYGSAGREIEYKTFLLNRILRIYPLLVVLLFVGVSAYGPEVNVGQVLGSLLPLQNLHGGVPTAPIGVYNEMFWTIGIEFQFYLIFPFLYRQLLARGVPGLVPLMILLLVARWSTFELDANPRDVAYWTILGRLDQFLIGMFAARVALRLTFAMRLLRWALPVGAVGLGAALFLFNQEGGWPVVGGWKLLWPPVEAVLWALVVLGYLAVLHGRHGLLSRLVAGLGAISYSMYLLHIVVITIVLNHDLRFHVRHSPFLSALLTALIYVVPATVLVSTLSYHVIEKPFLALRRRYLEPGPVADAPPAPRAESAPVARAEIATPAGRWLLACFGGVAAAILLAYALAGRLFAPTYASVDDHTARRNVEQAIDASDARHPGVCKVLFAPDEFGSLAVRAGLQLARAGDPFVVVGNQWKTTFGPQHDWRSLDIHTLRDGLRAWYIVPRGQFPPGVPTTALTFALSKEAMLVLTPPTLDLSAVDSTAELAFTLNGNARDFALGGWSNFDPSGTWTDGSWVAVTFHPQVVEGAGVRISVDAQPFLAAAQGLTRQRLRLYFNGTPIGPEQEFAAGGSVSFTVPAVAWNALAAKLDAQVSLAFELPDAVAPASLVPKNGNDDIRRLGLFVSKLRLQVTR